jgi:peptidoglycan/LPS O-acetylase OafA/YrhL
MHEPDATAPAKADAASGSDHSPELDGLRGVAVLLVLLVHFQIVPKEGPVEKALFFYTGLGWTGVDLFFVLSGFLITRILLRSRGRKGYYARFITRRALRIFPLYYLLLLLSPLLARVYGVPDWHGTAHGPIPVAAFYFYLQNYWLAFVGEAWGPMNITWSLAIEEQFYLLWPLLVARLELYQLRRVLVAFIVGALLLRLVLWRVHMQTASYELTPTRVDQLSFGALLATYAPSFSDVSRFVPVATRALPVAAGIFGVAVVADGGPSIRGTCMTTIGFSCLAIGWSSILVLCLGSPPGSVWRRLARSALLRFFGRYSYAMYLTHYFVREALRGAVPMLSSAETVPRILGTQWVVQVAFYLVAIALTVAVSLVSWYAFESRILKLKSRFGPAQAS